MAFQYLEILESIGEDKVRKEVQTKFMDDSVFAQLVRVIHKDGQHNLTFNNVVDMFSYFDTPISFGDDLFERLQELAKVEVLPEFKKPFTRFNRTPVDKSLVYLFSSSCSINKHKRYYYLKNVLERCNPIEFKWCMRIIGNREQLKEWVNDGITD